MRVLTAGRARATTLPYFGAGRWRMSERIPWWNTYRDAVSVVVGHFWRSIGPAVRARYGVRGQDVLAGVPAHDWMGLRRNVYCVDYSVGKRYLTRQVGQVDEARLAALRFPEWEVVHDDGTVVEVGEPMGSML